MNGEGARLSDITDKQKTDPNYLTSMLGSWDACRMSTNTWKSRI